MIEALLTIAGFLLVLLVIFIMLWKKEAEKRTEAEKKVKAHETLQQIDEDIANGGDVYINEQLREITRHVRGNSTSDDIGA